MTREEAKEKVFLVKDMRAVEHYNDNLVDGLWILRKDVIDFTDKIYDDFESRTCENCVWYTFFNDYANSCSHSTNYITRGIPKDFGCNKFEAKTVSTDTKGEEDD